MKNTIMLITGVLFSLLLHAQAKVFTGKVGTSPIIMELEVRDDDSAVFANYFYLKYRKNTAISGTWKTEGHISMKTFFANKADKDDAEFFELDRLDSTYTGTWALYRKRLGVELKPVDLNKYKNPYDDLEYVKKLKMEEPYKYVMMSAFVFNKDSSTTMGRYKLEWYKEKYTHVPMVQIRNDNNDPAIARINNSLKENALEECLTESVCGESTKDYDYTAIVQSVFASADVFSVNLCASYYCGGAHPGAGCVGMSWDIKTGALLELKDVLWFGKEMPEANDEQAWRIYTDSVFTPSIVKLYESLHPADMKDVGGDCEYMEPFNWQTVNWYFTQKGLRLGPVYPHYGMACSEPEWAVIPYSVLKQYRTPVKEIKLPGD